MKKTKTPRRVTRPAAERKWNRDIDRDIRQIDRQIADIDRDLRDKRNW